MDKYSDDELRKEIEKALRPFLEHINKLVEEKLKHERSGKEPHICKYCGILTYQPDEECYKNPQIFRGVVSTK